MKFKLVPTNDCTVEVTPRDAGNFGFIRFGGQDRTPREEYRLCETIKDSIKRHVDDVEYISIRQTFVYESDNGDRYDTLFEALEAIYDEDGGLLPNYSYRYKRPSDGGAGTVGTKHDFKSIVEEAWINPWEFKLTGTPLNEYQEKFLKRIIEASLESKEVKA